MIHLKKDTTLLFFGDSITHGGRERSMDGNHIIGHGYVDIIASKLGLENMERMPKFINKGIAGETISQMYARLNVDVLKNKPTIINILAGANDICRGMGLPYKMTTDNYIKIYQMMIDDIRKVLDHPTVILCEPFYLELNSRENPYEHSPCVECEAYFEPCYVKQTDAHMALHRRELTYMQEQLRDFAEKNHCIYVSLQDEFDAASKKAAPEYLIWDTIHPTIVGHELIARKWLETVEKEVL